MDKTGFIEIRITGSRGNLELSPDTYDIREIISMLENAEKLLYPNEKKNRPVISYRLEEGSVKHIFNTSIQYIIGFNAIIGQVNQNRSIDFLDSETARAIENIQEVAVKKNYVFSLKTSLSQSNEITIDKTTRFYRTEAIWADAEFYFYGKVTDAGGKDKANIHLSTDEFGSLTIDTPRTFLEKYEENILYKTFGIRATGKQNSETGEIDKSSLRFIELIDYYPKYDESYLKTLREKAKKNWLNDIDPDSWLNQMRGGYEA